MFRPIIILLFCYMMGSSLTRPQPQELTLKDFADDIRPNGGRSLGEEEDSDFEGVLISSPYRQVRRQGRKGETNKIKFPTLTVENPNILAIGNPIQKVANENGPVFNNLLSTKDIEKIKEISKKEEEKREEQINKDIELLEEVSLLEKVVELEKEVDEELIELEVDEVLIELAAIDLTAELALSDVLYNDEVTEVEMGGDPKVLDDMSDVLYSDDASEELDIPMVVVEKDIIGNTDNLEVAFIEEQPLVDMIDVKIPALLGFEDEELFLPEILLEDVVSNADQDIEEATLASVSLNTDTDSLVPNIDFGQIQEV